MNKNIFLIGILSFYFIGSISCLKTNDLNENNLNSSMQNKTNKIENELFPVKVKEKWGYIDTTGKIIIEPVYNDARDFFENLAAANINGDWGFINKKGDLVVKAKYAAVDNFSEGLCSVRFNDYETGPFGYINANGAAIIKPSYNLSYPFSEGLALVAFAADINTWTYGYINNVGEEVIKATYQAGDNFSNGFAAVAANMQNNQFKWGYINKKGETVVKPQYDNALSFSEGKCLVFSGKNILGMDLHFNKIFELENYDNARPYSEGLALIEKKTYFKQDQKNYVKTECGYINEVGKVIIPLKYQEGSDFSEDLASVKLNGKWGYIDKKEKAVIDFIFIKAEPFKNGLARIWIGNDNSNLKMGYINKKGEYIWKPTN